MQIKVSQISQILKYFLFKCRCVGDKPSINGDIKYLYHCIQTKKTPINVLSSKQKECTVKSRVWSLYFTIHTLLSNVQLVFIILPHHRLLSTRESKRCLGKVKVKDAQGVTRSYKALGFQLSSCFSIVSFLCNVVFVVVYCFSFGNCVVCTSIYRF